MDGIRGYDWVVHEHTQLRAAAAQPATVLASPWEAQPALLLHAAAAPADLTTAERNAVATWLERQPCPVIGIGTPQNFAEDPWAQHYDVHVADFTAAAPLLQNIRRAPRAATVLVQTLRLTSRLSIMEGLLVESLAYASLQSGAEFQQWLTTQTRHAAQASTNAPAVLIERTQAHLDLSLNRPARRNAFSVEMRDALDEALQLALLDDTLLSVSLRGAGDSFSSGGDLDEFGTAPDSATAHLVRSLRLPARTLQQCIDRGRQITFHLHGACIGAGIELPAFAPRVVAAPKTFFQLPEIRFGLIPGAGGCVSLPRRIGRQRTAWLALSARRINTPTALAWGLINEMGSGL